MITQTSIDTLKSKLDIIDIVSAYIPLKKSGMNYGACCPFHGEKTPSFVVSAKKQIYHCFGCGVSGDAIKFVQEYEKITFSEAVEKLANNFGITLSYDKQKESVNAKALEYFADYFKSNLAKNILAKEYLAKRGVSQNSIEKFHIGWAGTSKEQIEYAKHQHMSLLDLTELGVFAHGESGLYARFVERIIFPIKNQNGKVIGFGGRTLSNHPAKYINSPSTRLFDKSAVLYGFDLAKEAISKQKELILCEGYMDVIALHQNSFTNACAVLGTALTQKHLPQIKRFDAKVYISFDGDKAGQNAGLKSANLLIQNDILGRVVKWGDGVDPADLIDKSDEINIKLKQTESLYEFVLKAEISTFELSDTQQKQRAVKRIGEVLNSFGDIAAKELKDYAAAILGVGEIAIKKNTQKRQDNVVVTPVAHTEACIIRAMYESTTLLEYASTRLSRMFFQTYQQAFDSLISGDDDDLTLLQLLSNNQIQTISNEHFYSFVNILKKEFLKRTMPYIDRNNYLYSQIKRAIMLNANQIDDELLEQVLSCYNNAKKA